MPHWHDDDWRPHDVAAVIALDLSEVLMESTASPLFNHGFSADPRSLTGALQLHCRAVEDVLLSGGQVPGIGYVALDVVRLATTLMAAAVVAEDGCPRWFLPEPDREDSPVSREDGDDLPF